MQLRLGGPGINGQFLAIEREFADLMKLRVGDEKHLGAIRLAHETHAMRSGHASRPVGDESAAFCIEDDHVVASVIGQKQQTAFRVDHDGVAVFHIHLGQSLTPPFWHHLITKLALAEDFIRSGGECGKGQNEERGQRAHA